MTFRLPPLDLNFTAFVYVGGTIMKPSESPYARQVFCLVLYYILILLLTGLLLGWVWLVTERIRAVIQPTWLQPLAVPLLSAALGGAMGNVLYSIRVLYLHYVKEEDYDPRWLGKYYSGPFEAALLSLIVYALVRGGVASLTGVSLSAASQDVPTSEATVILAAFGIGALVGFSIRDVVGWLQGLSKTIFRHEEEPEDLPEGPGPLG